MKDQLIVCKQALMQVQVLPLAPISMCILYVYTKVCLADI